MSTTDTLVIYNPVAGRGRARVLWPRVEQALWQGGVDFEAVATSAPRQAEALARAAPHKFARVVSVGGDGTLHEIVNGLLQASGEGQTIPLGLVPLGNGDDFAKGLPPEAALGSKSFDWRAAVEKIQRSQTRLYDAGRMVEAASPHEPRYFINGMDVGFGAQAGLNFLGTQIS
jgi:diacylglycerol kinase (ATP)